MVDLSLSNKYSVSLVFAGVGGYLEAYTFVTRDGVFANSQTGNIARMGISFARGDYTMVLRYFIPVLVFVIGVFLSLRLKLVLARHEGFPLSYSQLIVSIEMVLVIVTGFIPAAKMDVLATVLVSLVCAIQVESFRHFGENAFSSTMCTGNLRLGTEKIHAYLSTGDRQLLKTAFMYYGIDLVFAVFAAVGFWLTTFLGVRAVWCTLVIPLGLFLAFALERRSAPKSEI